MASDTVVNPDVLVLGGGGIVGVRAKRVRWIAIYDRGRIRSPSALREYLLRTTPD